MAVQFAVRLPECDALQMREEIVERRIAEYLAVKRVGSILEDRRRVIDFRLAAELRDLLALHENRERRLITHIGLGLHLHADFLELFLAAAVAVVLVRLYVIVLIARAAAEDDIELAVHEQVRIGPPKRLDLGPVIELEPAESFFLAVGLA